jgi:hypothetical protein
VCLLRGRHLGHDLAQPGQPAGVLAADRAHRAAQQGGDLALGAVLEVAQDHHGALARRQLEQSAVQRIGLSHVVGEVTCRRACGLGRLGGQDLGQPASAPPGHVLAVEHRPDVGLGVTSRHEPCPAQAGLGERGLDQVLGELLVAGQQVRRPQQGAGTGRHEGVERALVRHRASRLPDHRILGLPHAYQGQ